MPFFTFGVALVNVVQCVEVSAILAHSVAAMAALPIILPYSGLTTCNISVSTMALSSARIIFTVGTLEVTAPDIFPNLGRIFEIVFVLSLRRSFKFFL